MLRTKLAISVITVAICIVSAFYYRHSNTDKRYSQYRNTIALFEEKLQEDPSNCIYLKTVAVNYSMMALYNESIAFYLKLLNICPNDYSSIFQLGTCYMIQGFPDTGIEYMDKAIGVANENGDIEMAKAYGAEKKEWLKNKQKNK